ncbi:hypothetical protein BsWGS_10131 [Bradybaena similaris]
MIKVFIHILLSHLLPIISDTPYITLIKVFVHIFLSHLLPIISDTPYITFIKVFVRFWSHLLPVTSHTYVSPYHSVKLSRVFSQGALLSRFPSNLLVIMRFFQLTPSHDLIEECIRIESTHALKILLLTLFEKLYCIK